MRPRQADQRIAAVDRRAQHDGIPIANGIHRRAQNRCRQGGAVGIDQNRSGMTGGEQIGRRAVQSRAEIAVALQQQTEARRQQRAQRRFGPGRRIDGIGRNVAVQRQAVDGGCEIADKARRERAAFLGRSGGDSLVLDRPAAGVLQKIPTATDRTAIVLRSSAKPGTAGRVNPS